MWVVQVKFKRCHNYDSSSIKTEIYTDGKTLGLSFLHLQMCRYMTNWHIYYAVGVSHTHLKYAMNIINVWILLKPLIYTVYIHKQQLWSVSSLRKNGKYTTMNSNPSSVSTCLSLFLGLHLLLKVWKLRIFLSNNSWNEGLGMRLVDGSLYSAKL